ncbi:MAG: response regulator SirA, partial [Chloroflexi bacterium]
MTKITHIVKRTGAVVPFNQERITNAIYRAAVAVGGRDRSIAEQLSGQVVAVLEEKTPPGHTPTIEEIQDTVEKVLIENGRAKTAKAYILYRDERARQRQERAQRSLHLSENVPWRKLWEVLNWSVDHDLHTVER